MDTLTVATGSFLRRGSLALILTLVLAPLAWANEAPAGFDHQITDISLSSSGEGVEVRVATTARPDHSHYQRSNPLEVVVDIADMEPGGIEPVIPVHDGVIRDIRSERMEKDGLVTTRLVIALDDAREYSTRVEDHALVLDIERGGYLADDAIADEIDDIEEKKKIQEESQQGEDEDENPVRDIIDGELSSVHGDHVWRGSGTKVLGVDFQNFEEHSSLIITGDSRLDYTSRWATQRQFVIDLQGATLGTGLERSLDTSRFPSAIDMIHCYQSRSQPGTVKVVIRMRTHVEPKPAVEGNVLRMDFEIPPSVAAAGYEDFAVFGSYEEEEDEDGISEEQKSITGAFSRETVITSQGQSLDPSKKYGTPGGQGLILEGQWDLRHITGGKAPRLINLDLVNADIHNVFRLISSVSGLNIVSSDSVGGTVTVRMDRVPWDQALAAILQSKGLGGILYGNILRIAPLNTIRAEREAALQAQKASIELQELAVLTLPVNYADAMDMSKHIGEVLSDRGSVSVDERTNSLVIQDIEESLRQARLLVMALDTQTPQVQIDARIVEVNTNFSQSAGIQWGGNLNFSPGTGMPTGLFFPNSVGVSGGKSAPIVLPGGQQGIEGLTAFTTDPNWVVDLPAASDRGSLGIGLGSITGVLDLDLRLSALESTGEGRVVSSPRITVVTNEEAYIKQGTRVPYETASLRGTQVQFIEATLELRVTPSITSDGSIFLDLSVTKNRPDFGNTVGNNPSIEIKEAQTMVMVPNGDTTVIGGVYSLEEAEDRTYIPGIGKVPVLGALFGSKDKRRERKEMLVFITPTILSRVQPRAVSSSVSRGD